MKKISLFLFLIFLLSLPLVLPFFRSGYFPTHDGEWAVVRLGAMHRALMAGQFPVRWAGNLNFSYGYPLFLFTYPLPYYLGEVFYLFGFGLIGAIKTLFVLSVILSGLAMFLLGKELFDNAGGLIAAIFYLYAPFRLVDLYVRGSLGESLAFVFFPLLFWILLKIAQDGYRWVSIGAVFFAGLLLTHNVSALLFTPFLIAFAAILVFQTSKKKRIPLAQRMLFAFILGLGLAAFFLLPALAEKKNIVLSQMRLADVREHFVNLRQLIIPDWGYGSPGTEDAFSFQLGWVHLMALFLAIFIKNTSEVAEGTPRRWRNRVFLFSSVSLAILVLSMLPISFLFWQKTPLFSEIDFPWRALGLATFFLALSLGYLTVNRFSRYLALALAVLVIFINLGYAKPSGFINNRDAYYLTNEATTTSKDELMPIWVREKPTERAKEKVEIVSEKGTINNIFFNSKKVSFAIEAETELEVQINTIYFPGWKVRVDGNSVKIDYQNKQGLIRFKVESGKHQIVAEFGETPFRLLSDIISLFSLAAVIFIALPKVSIVKHLRGVTGTTPWRRRR